MARHVLPLPHRVCGVHGRLCHVGCLGDTLAQMDIGPCYGGALARVAPHGHLQAATHTEGSLPPAGQVKSRIHLGVIASHIQVYRSQAQHLAVHWSIFVSKNNALLAVGRPARLCLRAAMCKPGATQGFRKGAVQFWVKAGVHFADASSTKQVHTWCCVCLRAFG